MIYRETMESEFFEEWFREILLGDIEKLWANMKKKLKDIAHNFNTLEEAVTSVLFNKLVQF